MRQYIYRFGPGDRPALATDPGAWTRADELVAGEHVRFLSEATQSGVVILAGRSPDGVGPAIVVFEAEDPSAARRFMESDPFVSGGLFTASLHEFRVAMLRGVAD